MTSHFEKAPRSVKLWELRRPEVEGLRPHRTLVLLPTGSIEQHGLHLPLDTDIHDAFELSVRVAERARAGEIDGTLVVAPPVWWGTSPHHMAYPGTISLQMKTMSDLIVDICRSLIHHGLYRILIVNGHGGNNGVLSATTLRMAEELGVSIPFASYWTLIREDLVQIGESEIGGMAHACEMETSLQWFLRSEGVDTARLVRDMPVSRTSYSGIDFRSPGPVMFPWDLTRDSETGAMGDPTQASIEKGRRIAEAAERELLKLASELLALAPKVVFPMIQDMEPTFTIHVRDGLSKT